MQGTHTFTNEDIEELSTQYVSRPQATPCCDREDSLDGMPLAMAYVPWQIWQRIYEAEKGFCRGTIFEELDKPFHGMGGCNR